MHLRLQLNLNYGNKINIIQKQIKTLFEKKPSSVYRGNVLLVKS